MDKSKKPSEVYLYFANGDDIKGPKKKPSKEFSKRVRDWLEDYIDWGKIKKYVDEHPDEFKQ